MLRPLAALSLALVLLPGSALAFPISTCGVQVSDGDVGTLAADLNCTDPGTPAVRLGRHATLELAGHSIQGISAEPMVSHNVITCLDKACTIVGPGDISGNDGTVGYGTCVFGPVPGVLTMTSDGQGEITVSNCGTGVAGGGGKLQDVHAEGNMVGINLFKKGKLTDVTASSNQFGVIGNRVRAVNLDASTNTEFGVVGNGGKRFAFAARRDDQVAVISTARLDPTFFGAAADQAALWLRTTKVLQRDLGALYYRLPNNDDPASLLHGLVPSVDALDHLPCAFSATDLEVAGRHPAGTP